MRRLTYLLVAALTLGAFSVGAPAQAANALCPQICLTGGIVGVGGARSVVAASEWRYYEFQWLAIDLTEPQPIQESLEIALDVNGTTTNGIFKGTGWAYLSKGYSTEAVIPIQLTANALTVSASSTNSEDFRMAGTVVGGGVAEYRTTYDHDWDGYCGEC